MPILTQKAVVLAKVETTSGTDAVPTAALNAIMVSNPSYSVQADEVTRNFTRNDFSNYASRYVRRRGQMTFTTEIRGKGTVDLAADWSVLLEGCGFVRSTVAVGTPADRDGILFTPASDSLKTLTIYMYFDGILHKMTGAMGSFTVRAEAGSIATAEFTFEGNYVTATNTAMVTPTLETTIPPIVELAGLKWNGSSTGIVAGDISINWENTIAQRLDVNSAQGMLAMYISGRNPTAGFTPEVDTTLSTEFWGSWEASTTRAMEFVVGGTGTAPGGSGASVEGNSVIFAAPAVQVSGIQYGDRDNIRTYDIGLALRRSAAAGNDELTILFS